MAFSSTRLFFAEPKWIPQVAEMLSKQFQAEGFTTQLNTSVASADLSITKGGLFKSVCGMKTALKIKLMPEGPNIRAEAGCGIFGQQAIPTIISMFVFWPVLLTQLWGLIQQSNLDDHAMELIERYLHDLLLSNATASSNPQQANATYCPSCGAKVTGRFCTSCGTKIE